MALTVKNIKGMPDLLPEQTSLWQWVEQEIQTLVGSYGYSEIRMPIVEYTDLFKRSIGEVTDIVEKESTKREAEARRDGTHTSKFEEKYNEFFGRGRLLKIADCLDDVGYEDYLQWVNGRYHSIGGQQLATIRKQFPDYN